VRRLLRPTMNEARLTNPNNPSIFANEKGLILLVKLRRMERPHLLARLADVVSSVNRSACRATKSLTLKAGRPVIASTSWEMRS
jgi:hypothetical protein